MKYNNKQESIEDFVMKFVESDVVGTFMTKKKQSIFLARNCKSSSGELKYRSRRLVEDVFRPSDVCR
jgi:hypothetical protein